MVYSEEDEQVRQNANIALHNVVQSHADDYLVSCRETRVLDLLDQIADYCKWLQTRLQSSGESIVDESGRHPLSAISTLMTVSFDEEHRQSMVELGALYAIPKLLQLECAVHGPTTKNSNSNTLRRKALMTLTNLTFGDENNKAVLCGQRYFMETLVAQLESAPDDLLQATASVLRNLSWRADNHRKAALNEIGTIAALVYAALKNKSENTLKCILAALWNVTAHSSESKAEFCSVEGALEFLVDMVTFEGSSYALKIIESAGGILREVSSHIAEHAHYRQILCERNALAVLSQQLTSESLTVVSNSSDTLRNLSVCCPEDQKSPYDNGAVPMSHSPTQSNQAAISETSEHILQNTKEMNVIIRSTGSKQRHTWKLREQKDLTKELELQQQILTKTRYHSDSTTETSTKTKHANISENKAAIEDDDSDVGTNDATWNRKERKRRIKLNSNREAHTSKRILFQNCNARLAQSVEHETHLRVWEFPTLGNWKKKK